MRISKAPRIARRKERWKNSRSADLTIHNTELALRDGYFVRPLCRGAASLGRSGRAAGAVQHLSRWAVGLDRGQSALRASSGRIPSRRYRSGSKRLATACVDPRGLTQENSKYWADQVDIQYEIAAAWITLAEGKREQALQQMRSAADHEDRTDKDNVTPGVILPARELLGEMLLEIKQPAPAMAEFEATLRTAPNRFNALSGAARAAKLSGDKEKAKTYYAQLLSICAHADGDRPELQDARSLLAQK